MENDNLFRTNESNDLSNQEIITLLKQQNELMVRLESLLNRSMERDEQDYGYRAYIKDFNMSIGSMIGLSFKWLVESIPLGIVLGIIYSIIYFFHMISKYG